MNYTPKAGDIVLSKSGVYRMYYRDDWSKNLRCLSLGDVDAYADTSDNASGTEETYVCNMKDIVDAAR